MVSQELIEKVDKILADEGLEKDKDMSADEMLSDFILPAMAASKDVLGTIYYQSRERAGLLGQIKTKIQNVIIATVINILEKPMIRQQKFNELTYKAIEILIRERKSN